MSVIRTQEIHKYYKNTNELITIFENLTFELNPKDQVAISGVSGIGKSTFLWVIAGLDHFDQGDVFWNETPIKTLGETQLATKRNQHIGFVYQFHHLLPEFDITFNIALPLLIRNVPYDVAREQAQELLKEVGLLSKASRFPFDLSGGERQRVAVCRAIIGKPECILADEPTGQLDEYHTQHIFELLTNMSELYQTALIIVTHDPKIAKSLSCEYTMTNKTMQRIK